MPQSTSQPQGEPTPAPLAPQPNRILATPDTPASCQQEYAAAADVRDRLDEQIRSGH